MSVNRKTTGKRPSERDRTVKRNGEIDEEIEESFPASDPPSYAGGRHSVGAPAHAPKPKTKR